MRRGDLPFRDVFSSQGPVFLPLVWIADLLGFRTLDAPRLLSVASGVLVTIAVYSCARRVTDARERAARSRPRDDQRVGALGDGAGQRGRAVDGAVGARGGARAARRSTASSRGCGTRCGSGSPAARRRRSRPRRCPQSWSQAWCCSSYAGGSSTPRSPRGSRSRSTSSPRSRGVSSASGTSRTSYHNDARRLNTAPEAAWKVLTTLWERDRARGRRARPRVDHLRGGARHRRAPRASAPADSDAPPVVPLRVVVAVLAGWAVLVFALLV